MNVFSFLAQLIGAFVVWAFKGFNGRFLDEVAKPMEGSFRSIRNVIITFVVVLFAYVIYTNVTGNGL